jgi:hypothetical protein
MEAEIFLTEKAYRRIILLRWVELSSVEWAIHSQSHFIARFGARVHSQFHSQGS